LACLLMSVWLPGCTKADEPDRDKEQAEQRKRFLDCFPEKARPLFDRPIPFRLAQRDGDRFGRQLADAVGDGETLALAVCRALGTLAGPDASWSQTTPKEHLALAGARTIADRPFLKALDRLKDDRQALLGAARMFFWEGFSAKVPEHARAQWRVRLAEVVLSDGWEGNKPLVLRDLGRDPSAQARDFLRDVFAGKAGKEIDRTAARLDEPGLQAGAALALAQRGDDSIKAEVQKRLAGARSKTDVAAYEVCLALFGDPKQIKAEHFRLRSYSIGLAGLTAIERFKGEHGMDALAKGAIHHPWAHVRDEALKTFTRRTGQTLSSGAIEDWYEAKYEGKRRPEPLIALRGNTDQLRSVAFSPDGKRVVCGSNDSTAKVWDVASGNRLLTLRGHTFTVIDAVFSPDGKFIATASGDQTVRIWDSTTGAAVRILRGHRHWVKSARYSPDGKLLVSAGDDGSAVVWDVMTGERKLQFRGHGGSVARAVFSPDGKAVASSGRGGGVRIWDALTGKELLVLGRGQKASATDLAFSPDGTKMATADGEDRTVRLWNTTTGEALLTLKGHTDWVASVAFAPDGKRIASTGWDKTVRLWDVQTEKEVLSFKAHPESVNRIAFSSDGKQLATASEDKTAKVWEIGKLLLRGTRGE